MRFLATLVLFVIGLGSGALLVGGMAGCQQAVFDGRTDLTVKFITNFLAGGTGLWCMISAFRGNPKYRGIIVALLVCVAVLYAVLLALKFWIGAAFSYDKEYVTVVAAALISALLYAVTCRYLPQEH